MAFRHIGASDSILGWADICQRADPSSNPALLMSRKGPDLRKPEIALKEDWKRLGLSKGNNRLIPFGVEVLGELGTQ